MKAGALIGMMAGVGAALMLAQSQSGVVPNGVQPNYQAQAAGIAQAVAQWKVLQQSDSLPFDTYASFLMAHPGWPNQTANRRAAEKQAATGYAAPASVVAFCRRFPPLTGTGWLACARAYQAIGAPGEAYAAARAAWRGGALSAQDRARC